MRDVTLCLLVREGEVCLGQKKRGFGEGKWNGFGGKVDGESVEDAAKRELLEEAGVEARVLEKVGEFEFWYEDMPEWHQRMHIFLIRSWEGEPQETEEMKPQWFMHADIPYESTWADDAIWLPRILQGEKLQGTFRFTEKGTTIRSHELRSLA